MCESMLISPIETAPEFLLEQIYVGDYIAHIKAEAEPSAAQLCDAVGGRGASEFGIDRRNALTAQISVALHVEAASVIVAEQLRGKVEYPKGAPGSASLRTDGIAARRLITDTISSRFAPRYSRILFFSIIYICNKYVKSITLLDNAAAV